MTIQYKIRGFNRDNGSIVVEFADFAPINIDLPIENNRYMEGAYLDTYIKGFLPTHVVQRNQDIKTGIENADAIAALVEAKPVETAPIESVAIDAEALRNAEMWAAQQFESQVAKALVKFGVLTEDPTVIPVSAN